MMSLEKQQVKRISCPLCGGTDLGTTEVTFQSGRKETVPVCNGCAHMAFADTTYSYAFNVRGIAHDWASADDLKGVIEDILKEYMPKGDTEGMEVSVQVSAEWNGSEEIYE